MTVFYSFLPTTVHTGAPAHDGLGRAALVRRFKSLKPSHKDVWPRLGPQAQCVAPPRLSTAPMKTPSSPRAANEHAALGRRTRRAASDTAAPSQPLAAVMHSYRTPLGGAAHQLHTTSQCAAAAAWLLAGGCCCTGEGDHGGTALITRSQGKL